MKAQVKQVAAWKKLLGYCEAIGDAYNPINEAIKFPRMQTLLNESVARLNLARDAQTFLTNTITERYRAFHALSPLTARVAGALASSNAPQERLDDVDMIRDRFRNLPLPPIPKEEKEPEKTPDSTPEELAPQTQDQENQPPKRKRRINYGDFGNRVESLELLISQLEAGTPPYVTNEEDISIPGLKQLVIQLMRHNDNVEDAKRKLHLAKTKCNELLYGEDGMYGLSDLVKRYVHSSRGFKSPEFIAVRGIEFRGK